ncbi:(deoxy)nucleoside triphosphate pyrophosphohydrolase [Paenisporosarcina indica]|uniref:(deoxy)nucleoside triphosphate pyrophosphohydrolase n=1 Tax=Paenisporosarcina indica TaxID=650093 RepID=UPI00094FD4C0|nr:(deoxy)nucleoside triphosphate pyrophosphohydrolase [Paenisporosarcina indica]
MINVVGAIIINDKKEILCALRSEKMALPNLWEFPGGKIEHGESHEKALIREIREELSCEIEVHQFVEDTVYEYETFTINLITYISKVINGTPFASEHAELKWVPIQELLTLEWAPADIPAVNKLLSNQIVV